MDETGVVADYVTPSHHDLENWGDAEFQKGVFSIQQPTIRPLHNTRSFQDSMLTWMRESDKTVASSWYEYIREYWKREVLGAVGFNKKWDDILHSGFFLTVRELSRLTRFQ